MSTIFPKVTIIGDSGVGKTDFVWTSIDSRPNVNYVHVQHESTIGMDYKTSTRILKNGEDTLRLQIYDTAGQERFAFLTRTYYKDATAIVIMYAVNDADTLTQATSKWFDDVKQLFHERPLPILFLIGTKSDMRRKVSVDQGRAAAECIGAVFLETNTRDDNGAMARATLDEIANVLIQHGVLTDRARRIKEEEMGSVRFRFTQRKKQNKCCQ
jgi:small GTP-binding protein